MNEINLVIDSNGHGQFHVSADKDAKTTLTFDIQIDESTHRYLIHTSMGRLDKIREIHPGMNILRTLTHWNALQKKRYRSNGNGNGSGSEDHNNNVRGGQLGIVPSNKSSSAVGYGHTSRSSTHNLIMMTLMGEYNNIDWEYDGIFSLELERFVEDALQFHLCLNGHSTSGSSNDDDDTNGTGGENSSSSRKEVGSALEDTIGITGSSSRSSRMNDYSSKSSSRFGDNSTLSTKTTTTTTTTSGTRRRSKLLLDKVLRKKVIQS